MKRSGNIVFFLSAVLMLGSLVAQAKLQDVEALQDKARANYIDHFTKFTQDKNVMSRPFTPDGKTAPGSGPKQSYDKDDGAPFQSELTYHDFAYDTIDEPSLQKAAAAKKANPNAESPPLRTLYAGISEHGAISAGGGSSLLERTVYELHEQFSKPETDKEKQKQDEAKGIKYRSLFKEETQEVFKDEKEKKGDNKIPDKVERRTIREEAISKVTDVGDRSYETVDKAAKSDPEAAGTLSLYYAAANKAFETLFKAGLANLTQARANRAVQPEDYDKNPRLNEDHPDANSWAQAEIAKIDPKDDPKDRQKKIEDINRMKGDVEKIQNASYKMINPEFEKDAQGKNSKLKEGELNKENGLERDWRVQLEILNKVGTKTDEVKSNWKYTDKDNRAKVTTSVDDKGNPSGTEQLRMDEQLERYNEQLRGAAADIPGVQQRFPDLKADPDKILSYQIQPKTKSATEIVRFPTDAAYEGYEIAPPESQTKLPENYNQLLKQK